MCDVNAICPVCHRADLDAHETRCVQLNDQHVREYACPCGAEVVIKIGATSDELRR